MPTNLEYRERESRRQAGEAQREKERQRAKNKGDIFCWKNNMKIW